MDNLNQDVIMDNLNRECLIINNTFDLIIRNMSSNEFKIYLIRLYLKEWMKSPWYIHMKAKYYLYDSDNQYKIFTWIKENIIIKEEPLKRRINHECRLVSSTEKA